MDWEKLKQLINTNDIKKYFFMSTLII